MDAPGPPAPAPPRRVYAFGDYRLDVDQRRLERGRSPVALPPRVFDTLVVLVERAGRLVTKEEILSTVWAGLFVEEANLTVTISALRRALGESPAGHGYVETVPRRGYRFHSSAVRLDAVADAVAVASLPPAPRSQRRVGLLVAVVLATAATLAAGWWLRRQPTPDLLARGGVRTLAVLPFRVTGEAASQPALSPDVLALGLADALITRLGGIRRLTVRPTSAVVAYAPGGDRDPLSAGRELAVDAVLTGFVQRQGAAARVTLQLVRTTDGALLWADTSDTGGGDLFALEDAIATDVARGVLGEPAGASSGLERHASPDPRAYELYLRARSYWFEWTPEGWEKARGELEQAVALDPHFARAFAGLADAIGVQGFVRAPLETAPRAKALAAEAIRLDPELADGYVSLGPLQFFFDRDWAAAEVSLRRALALDPHHPLAHDLLAILLVSTGRTADGLAAARRAVELDPRSSYLAWDLGEGLYFARRYDEAVAELERLLGVDPRFFQARETLSLVCEARGELARAGEEMLQALRLRGEGAAREDGLRRALAAGGWPGLWRERRRQLEADAATRYVSPYELATVAARLGEADRALAELELAERERAAALVRIAVDPLLDRLRGTPRFDALVARLGLSAVRVSGPQRVAPDGPLATSR